MALGRPQPVRELSFLSRIFSKKTDDAASEAGSGALPPNSHLPATLSPAARSDASSSSSSSSSPDLARRRRYALTNGNDHTELEEQAKQQGESWKQTRDRKSSFNPESIFEERIVGGSYPTRGPGPQPEKRLREWMVKVEDMTLGPKKLNLVAKLIRRLPVEEARLQLRFSTKQVSRDVLLALDEAVMKAREEADMHPKDLIVGQCWVGGKIAFKKVDIKARGKSGTIQKRLSSLSLVVYENPKLVPGFFSKTLTPTKSEHVGSRRAIFKPVKVKQPRKLEEA